MGFGLVIGFTEHLYTQNITASKYSAIANSRSAIHYSKSLACRVFTTLLVTASYGKFSVLWVPQLSPFLSYQLLTAIAQRD
jgi:hypothetical protein